MIREEIPESAFKLSVWFQPIRDSKGWNLREYASGIAGTPTDKALRHACILAATTRLAPAISLRTSSRSAGMTAGKPNSS